MKFRLWWLGAIAIVGLWWWMRSSNKVPPGTVFGSMPGTNLPGLFVVNTTRAMPNNVAASAVAPDHLFDTSIDTAAGSR